LYHVRCMQTISNIVIKDANAPIYLIVPGFLGNYSEGLVKHIHEFLIAHGKNVIGCVFEGHEIDGTHLLTLEEMTEQLSKTFALIRKKYPKNPIIVIAHSQGCALTLKTIASFDRETSIMLIAPAIFLDEIVLARASKDEIKMIMAGKPTKCNMARVRKVYRMVDKKWLLSYMHFSVERSGHSIARSVVIRPVDDFVEPKNAKTACDLLPNATYVEMEGDHIFANPKGAFDKLAKYIISW
jgi:predicted alpha/beta hydrolase family esterase